MEKERIELLRDKFVSIVETQLNGDLSMVDAKELGEVMDMAKDCEEMIKYCSESKYYKDVTDAMERNSDEVNMHYIDKYDAKYYTPNEPWRERMYYKTPYMRDGKEGTSPLTRKTYMEMVENGTDKTMKSKELEKYVNELAEDINEMLVTMDANDKAMLKQKISILASKM